MDRQQYYNRSNFMNSKYIVRQVHEFIPVGLLDSQYSITEPKENLFKNNSFLFPISKLGLFYI